jgi:hypothetical protein
MLFNRRQLVSPKVSAYIRLSTNKYLEKYLKTSREIDEQSVISYNIFTVYLIGVVSGFLFAMGLRAK